MNKADFKKHITVINRFVSLRQMMKLSGQSHVFPFYHCVSDNDLPHIKHLYPVISTKKFSSDIDFFLKNYHPVSTSKLVQQIKGKENPSERCFYISFDDGLKEFYEVAAPILVAKGIRAACFVNTDFIDNKAMFYRMKAGLLFERMRNKKLTKTESILIKEIFASQNLRYEKESDIFHIRSDNQNLLDSIGEILEVDFNEYSQINKPYLSLNQIQSLISNGFTIGSHSTSHPNYEKLDEKSQLKETLGSVSFLKNNFHQNEILFSFPFTDFNVKKSFFEQIAGEIDLTFGTANMKKDEIVTNLQRIPMERAEYKDAESILKAEYLFFILKKMVGRHIIYRA